MHCSCWRGYFSLHGKNYTSYYKIINWLVYNVSWEFYCEPEALPPPIQVRTTRVPVTGLGSDLWVPCRAFLAAAFWLFLAMPCLVVLFQATVQLVWGLDWGLAQWPMGQIQSIACLCIAWELRMVFTFWRALKRIWHFTWPTKPAVFTIWPFTEKVG